MGPFGTRLGRASGSPPGEDGSKRSSSDFGASVKRSSSDLAAGFAGSVSKRSSFDFAAAGAAVGDAPVGGADCTGVVAGNVPSAGFPACARKLCVESISAAIATHREAVRKRARSPAMRLNVSNRFVFASIFSAHDHIHTPAMRGRFFFFALQICKKKTHEFFVEKSCNAPAQKSGLALEP